MPFHYILPSDHQSIYRLKDIDMEIFLLAFKRQAFKDSTYIM